MFDGIRFGRIIVDIVSWESKGTTPPKATPPGNKALLPSL